MTSKMRLRASSELPVRGRVQERLPAHGSNLECSKDLSAEWYLRMLGPRDVREILRVHHAILDSLSSKDFMYRHERGFFDRLLRFSGRMIGAFYDGELVGYVGIRLRPAPNSVQASCLTRLGVD